MKAILKLFDDSIAAFARAIEPFYNLKITNHLYTQDV